MQRRTWCPPGRVQVERLGRRRWHQGILHIVHFRRITNTHLRPLVTKFLSINSWSVQIVSYDVDLRVFFRLSLPIIVLNIDSWTSQFYSIPTLSLTQLTLLRMSKLRPPHAHYEPRVTKKISASNYIMSWSFHLTNWFLSITICPSHSVSINIRSVSFSKDQHQLMTTICRLFLSNVYWLARTPAEGGIT